MFVLLHLILHHLTVIGIINKTVEGLYCQFSDFLQIILNAVERPVGDTGYTLRHLHILGAGIDAANLSLRLFTEGGFHRILIDAAGISGIIILSAYA